MSTKRKMSYIHKKQGSKPQLGPAQVMASVSHALQSSALLTRQMALPFRYSPLACALSVCLFAQVAVQPAYAAQDSRIPKDIRDSLSERDLSELDEMLIETNQDDMVNDESIATNDQIEEALIALKLKKAVEKGIISRDVLEDYQRETFDHVSNKKNTAGQDQMDNLLNQSSDDSALDQVGKQESSRGGIENIDATIDFASDQVLSSPQEVDAVLNQINSEVEHDFTQPVATLDAAQPPIGLDSDVDALTNFTPSNRATLGLDDEQSTPSENEQTVASTQSDKTVIDGDDLNSKDVSLTDTDPTANETAQANQSPDVTEEGEGTGIDPDQYLPEYDSEVNGGFDEETLVAREDEEEEESEAKPGFFKRVYNRLFNDGYAALPRIKANIYLEQPVDGSEQRERIKADSDQEPANNIKASMENISVEAIKDFTAATPKLRQEAINAAEAVGYYDVKLRFDRVAQDEVNVIIEELGEPVTVSSRILEVRGEGESLEAFQEIEENAAPKEGDVFNHGVYKETKGKVEKVRTDYGFFDGEWLNSSVDVILPDNTADVDLIYNTGERYEFDNVVFFTIDKDTGKLTTDPDKLPVKSELLHQLHDFKVGDPFYGPLITKFTNDLSATRYFNTVNVETIRPSATPNSSSLAFDDDSDSVLPVEQANSSTESVLEGYQSGDEKNENIDQAAKKFEDADDSDDIQSDSEEVLANNSTSEEGDTASNNASKNNASNTDEESEADEDLESELAPIEYSVDQETTEKLASITQKAERLSRLPDDRVLDEEEEEAKSILGKISNAISRAVEKIVPDDKDELSDTDALPEDLGETFLASRKTPQEVAETKSVPLYVFVTADKPKDVDLGVGYGTDTGVRALARLEHNLINKEGYQAGISVGTSKINKSINVHASRPWKHPLNDILTGSVSYEQEEINQGEGNIDLETNTVEATVARKIRKEEGWNRVYSVRYRLDDLESGITGPDRENLPVPFNREGASFEQEALLFGYQIDKTIEDSPTNPTQGYRQYYSIEAGSENALTDTDMAIARAGVSGLYSFGEMNKHQVLASLDAGYIWADNFEEVPYKLRFFAGGDRSIRGYDYNSLSAIEKGYLVGGQVLALGSTEYNYEFKPGLRGAVFADFGNAYDKDFEAETKLGVGFGVRWASPVGMVRVDLAAGVLEDSIPVRLHLFVGSPLQ